MTIVGCDLHTRKQQVAVLQTDTGEMAEQELIHEGDAVEQFYRTLPRPVTVGIESTGYALWFHELMQRPAGGRGRQDPGHGRAQDEDRPPRRPTPARPAEA
jgi:hypothetical protein